QLRKLLADCTIFRSRCPVDAAQLFARRHEVHGSSSAYYFWNLSSREWRMMSGIWLKVKTSVIGMIAQTLNATQKSVEKPRQTISLSTARNRKKIPQRSVSLRQPSA